MQGKHEMEKIEAAVEHHLSEGRKSAADDTKQLIGRIETLEEGRPSDDAVQGVGDPQAESAAEPGGHFARTLQAVERAAEAAAQPSGVKQTGKRKS